MLDETGRRHGCVQLHRGKAEVEDALRQANIPRAIVRPTLIVGPSDVLTNNIAWFLRRLRDHGAGLGQHYVNDVVRHFEDGAHQPILDPAGDLKQ